MKKSSTFARLGIKFDMNEADSFEMKLSNFVYDLIHEFLHKSVTMTTFFGSK